MIALETRNGKMVKSLDTLYDEYVESHHMPKKVLRCSAHTAYQCEARVAQRSIA